MSAASLYQVWKGERVGGDGAVGIIEGCGGGEHGLGLRSALEDGG